MLTAIIIVILVIWVNHLSEEIKDLKKKIEGDES
jgi:predicted Holliday junction resolvase-like endonuclease